MRWSLIALALFVIAIAIGAALAWAYTPDKPRAALEARYAAPPSSFVDVLGVRLHVRDTGPRDAPAIIMLHGIGASLHTWEDWAGRLDGAFRVIRLDIPGFGLTGPDPSGDYSDLRSIAIIAALMDRLGLARASLVGSSMGGRIAWTFASYHPARVERLVLVAPDGFASPGFAYGRPSRVPLLARLLPYTLPTALLRASLAPAYADRGVMTEELVTRYRDMMLAPGVRDAILARMAQHVLAEPEPLLQRIDAPTLLVWGEKDAMVPATNAADYQRVLRQSSLVVFPGVGHLPHEEAPAIAVEAIREFLGPLLRS